jgi:hypothetical protein
MATNLGDTRGGSPSSRLRPRARGKAEWTWELHPSAKRKTALSRIVSLPRRQRSRPSNRHVQDIHGRRWRFYWTVATSLSLVSALVVAWMAPAAAAAFLLVALVGCLVT